MRRKNSLQDASVGIERETDSQFDVIKIVSDNLPALINVSDNLSNIINATTLTDAEIKTKYENNADTNAFTDTEKSKLGTLQNYTHPPTHAASEIVESTAKRFVSDAQIASWDAKPDQDTTYSIGDGELTEINFTATLRDRLLGIPTNANYYEHPATHLPTEIATDVNNRFVTDAQIASWNAKSDTDTQLTVEEVQDIVAAFLQQGTNVILNHDDVGNTLTISATGVGGDGANWGAIGGTITDQTDLQTALNSKADSSQVQTAVPVGAVFTDTQRTDEEIRDVIAAFIQQGTNTTVVHDDVNNTLTISSSGAGSYTHPTQSAINFSTTGAEVVSDITVNTEGHTVSVNKRTLTLLDLNFTGDSNANNYTHPPTHPPSIIAQDASNRFVTDAQIASWDSKASSDTQRTDEEIQDVVAAMLVQGANTTITYDDVANTLTIASAGGGSGISNLVEDTTPQLGGDLDLNTFSITGLGISHVDNLQTTLNNKVNNSQVLTDVPAGAVFTDTTYSVTDGQLSEKNFTIGLFNKLGGIADNANNYEHPSNDGDLHVPATGVSNNGKVLMAGATAGSMSWEAIPSPTVTWGDVTGTLSNQTDLQSALDAKADASQVLTNVPAGAVFTDTTYTVGDGQLTQINFTTTLRDKLVGIADNANNYTHPSLTAQSVTTTGSEVLSTFTSNAEGHITGITKRTLTKADLGLGNADNTSDVNKPVSTAQQAALDAKADTSALTGKLDGLGGIVAVEKVTEFPTTPTAGYLYVKVSA